MTRFTLRINSFKKARKAADNVNVSLMKGEVKPVNVDHGIGNLATQPIKHLGGHVGCANDHGPSDKQEQDSEECVTRLHGGHFGQLLLYDCWFVC